MIRRPHHHRLFTGPHRPRPEDTAPITPLPPEPDPLDLHDAACFHCGRRTTAFDPVCLTCRGRDPRKITA
jgi:hypothetical protein